MENYCEPGQANVKERGTLWLKKEINPAAAGAVIVVIVLVVGIFIWRGGQAQTRDGEKPPGIPPDAAAEMQRRMGGGGMTAPGKQPNGGTPGGK